MKYRQDTCPKCGQPKDARAKLCRDCYGARGHSPIEALFWAKVDKRGPDECWNWTAGLFKTGYGKFNMDGKLRRAHRVSWEFANGRPAPDDLMICHTCDNRACVNPAHLFLGTRSDNMKDAVKKGRAKGLPPGESHPSARLTVEQVREIRAVTNPDRQELARKYGVTPVHIDQIRARLKWKHV